MKERHFKSWLIQGSTFCHTKLKVFSKTVSKSIFLRNITICRRKRRKILTSAQHFLCTAQIHQSDEMEINDLSLL
jgi:hypothetical protein